MTERDVAGLDVQPEPAIALAAFAVALMGLGVFMAGCTYVCW